MNNDKNKIQIVTLLLVLYYVIISWIMHRNGFEHTESLFYSEKLNNKSERGRLNLIF